MPSNPPPNMPRIAPCAESAGARIITALRDQPYGDRNYGAEDLEGHRGSFAQHLRDVRPEDMMPPA